jgi:hypothetical protein
MIGVAPGIMAFWYSLPRLAVMYLLMPLVRPVVSSTFQLVHSACRRVPCGMGLSGMSV